MLCRSCTKKLPIVARRIGFCLDCLRSGRVSDEQIAEIHHPVRSAFRLPKEPPNDPNGRKCSICANECRIRPGSVGYCGLPLGYRRDAIVSWYHDPLPTNCVADWVCAGGTGAGFPKFAYVAGPEIGYKNLAVFYGACTFNCLFCQNWHYRLDLFHGRRRTPAELAQAVDERTSCICFYGGDPTPQLPHAIASAREALKRTRGRILRICFETNGMMHRKLLGGILDLVIESGGCIKFDLKAWSDSVHRALTGVSNKAVLENLAHAASQIPLRPEPPPVVASTLLVPGYVDAEEVHGIARLIASLNPNLPYRLLAFRPAFVLSDLPPTSWRHAQECLQSAREAGLTRVSIGNVHLLRHGDNSQKVVD